MDSLANILSRGARAAEAETRAMTWISLRPGGIEIMATLEKAGRKTTRLCPLPWEALVAPVVIEQAVRTLVDALVRDTDG